MNDTKSNPATSAPISTELSAHFIKSTAFRVIQANGAWFGSDPQQNLHFTFFSERNPIPTEISLRLNEKGQFIGEDLTKRHGKTGLLRELEVDVVMTLGAATQFCAILQENINQAEAFLKKQREDDSV